MHRRYGYNEEFKTEETKDDTNRAYPAPLRRIFNSNYMNVDLEVIRSASEITTTIAPRSSIEHSRAWIQQYRNKKSALIVHSKVEI